MAALSRSLGALMASAVVAGSIALGAVACDDLQKLAGTQTPLVRIPVVIEGDVTPFRPAGTAGEPLRLRVALVWAARWLPEPYCVLPPESPASAAVIAAGCRDPFGFIPRRVAVSAPVDADGAAVLELFEVPSADLMIGDVTARVIYGSLVVFDDRDASGTLQLSRAAFDQPDDVDGGLPASVPSRPADVIYGASFVTMTQPDQRVAFREGGFDPNAAFFPRNGCAPPPAGFSVVEAGGFSPDEAVLAALMGKLPEQDPATCSARRAEDGKVAITVRHPDQVRHLACFGRGSLGVPRYREPSVERPRDWDRRQKACVKLPDLSRFGGGEPPGQVEQLVMSDPPELGCKIVSHFVLAGCENDPTCETPEWDRRLAVPEWWPCATP